MQEEHATRATCRQVLIDTCRRLDEKMMDTLSFSVKDKMLLKFISIFLQFSKNDLNMNLFLITWTNN